MVSYRSTVAEKRLRRGPHTAPYGFARGLATPGASQLELAP